MEGGNTVIEYITYGILALIILAMIAMLVRTIALAVGFLSLPVAEALHRWAPTRRWIERRVARDADRLGPGSR